MYTVTIWFCDNDDCWNFEPYYSLDFNSLQEAQQAYQDPWSYFAPECRQGKGWATLRIRDQPDNLGRRAEQCLVTLALQRKLGSCGMKH